MTAKTKTKRDRSAGRHHRHAAIQTIVNNHQGIIDDIASIDNSIAALQDETCNLGSRLDHWYTLLDEKNTHTRQNVAYTMRCVVENERKQSEVESAVGILQQSSKEHQGDIAILNRTSAEHKEAIAQLVAYVNKVHGKQVALNQEINLLQAEVDDTNRRLFQLAWITVGLWAIAAITIFAYLITTH
ncbi:hypothetical protein [uncultured Rothia sp.]|uniref:hypothetical protein n=1 Tax=uncultured Rothia sp. TaxID=316088 RepID=UPI00288A66A2|nr:hypothetical protein [uncultured Rothia sp.]